MPSEVDGRECILAPGDTVRFGDVLVTSPSRTAMDLLLTEKEFPVERAEEVRHLLALSDDDAAGLQRRLRRRPRPGSARGIERLGLVAAGPPISPR